MEERSHRTSVEFVHPFRLDGVDGLQPAGSYEVETVEEQIAGLSFVAYRRRSTTITLPGPTILSRQLVEIDPTDLAQALSRDAELPNEQS
jgi:hypothetical protein